MEQALLKVSERGTTFLLKVAIFIVGLIVLALCIFWLPSTADGLENLYPEFSYLKYPLLFGIYVTSIPFYFALYQAFRILHFIDKNTAFSNQSVNSLKFIKYCAFIIAILYFIGFNGLLTQNAANPGILLLGLVFMFASIVIGIFAAILQKLLINAIHIKEENELTV